MEKNSKNNNLSFAIIIILGIVALVMSIKVATSNLSSKDSGAIYGGRIEKSYISAGYIISYDTDQKADLCGMVKIDNNLLLTAAHCFNNVAKVFINPDPTQPDLALSAQAAGVYKNGNWHEGSPKYDIAIVNYNDNNSDTENIAKVVSPRIGCNYSVVGYGRTENDGETIGKDRTKRSATVCIEAISAQTFTLVSQDGGICLGDSGSPIYETGTENIVGVISSVLAKGDDTSVASICYVGNEAEAVRADANVEFISKVASSLGIDSNLGSDVFFSQAETVGEELSPKGRTIAASLQLFVVGGGTILGLKFTTLLVALIVVVFAVTILLAKKAILKKQEPSEQELSQILGKNVQGLKNPTQDNKLPWLNNKE